MWFNPNVKKMEEKHDVKGLIQASQHEERSIREYAAKALVRVGDVQGIKALIWNAKGGRRDYVRVAAIVALTDEALIDNVIHAFAKLDEDTIDAVISAFLESKEWWQLRIEAIQTLGKIGQAIANEKVVEALISALNDPNLSVREAAASALKQQAGVKGHEALQAYKNESERPKPELLSRYMGLIGDGTFNSSGADVELVRIGAPAVEPLVEKLRNAVHDFSVLRHHRFPDPTGFGEDPSFIISRRSVQQCVEVLGTIGDDRAVNAIGDALSSGVFTANLDKYVLGTLRYALEKIGGEKAKLILSDFSKQGAEMTRCALCGEQISAEEMESGNEVLDLLGVGKGEPSPLDDIFRGISSTTQAWKCDACGQRLCNSCVTTTVIKHQASAIQHSNCGGMFRAPGTFKSNTY